MALHPVDFYVMVLWSREISMDKSCGETTPTGAGRDPATTILQASEGGLRTDGVRCNAVHSHYSSVEISPTKADKRRVSCRPAEATRPGSAVFAALGSSFSTWVIFLSITRSFSSSHSAFTVCHHRLSSPFVNKYLSNQSLL